MATGNYSNGTTQNLTALASWQSSNTSVATVSSTGLATAVAAGSTQIYAFYQGQSANVVLTVSSATLSSLSVTPTTATIASGTTQQFTATGTPSDGSTQNLTNSVTWSSSLQSVATINASGLATGEATGEPHHLSHLQHFLILCRNRRLERSAPWHRPWRSDHCGHGWIDHDYRCGDGRHGDPQLDHDHSSGAHSADWSHYAADGHRQLFRWQHCQHKFSGSVDFLNARDRHRKHHWTVTAKASGRTNVTATMSSVTGTNAVMVTSAVLQSIVVQTPETSFPLGLSVQLTAIGTYSDSSTQNLTSSVTWSSQTPSIGVVNSSGLATGVRTGAFNAAATFDGVTGTLQLNVTGAVLQSIAVTPANQIIVNLPGNTLQFTATGSYTDGTTQNITNSVHWSLGGVDVGTISATGSFSAVAIGLGTVTATSGTISGTTDITVVSL
jgi:hypothetical protein